MSVKTVLTNDIIKRVCNTYVNNKYVTLNNISEDYNLSLSEVRKCIRLGITQNLISARSFHLIRQKAISNSEKKCGDPSKVISYYKELEEERNQNSKNTSSDNIMIFHNFPNKKSEDKYEKEIIEQIAFLQNLSDLDAPTSACSYVKDKKKGYKDLIADLNYELGMIRYYSELL